jgi:phospholipid/cholesterol/gamma-HCH transport system substrate-binding protein
MRRLRFGRTTLALLLVAVFTGAVVVLTNTVQQIGQTHVVAYFANSNGIFVGDDVRIRGVSVGTIDRIDPEPSRVKITFRFDDSYQVPADVKAVILSPTLVTARAIQLTPPYRGGPTLADGAVIPENRTAVPVEWDDVRDQLERLTTALQPTGPDGVSTLGAFVNATADNLRGQGAAIRDSLIKLSTAVSALGDHSSDIFSSVRNLSALVSALQDSTTLLRQLNQNFAAVTGLFANDQNEVANALRDFNAVIGKVRDFVAENRETLGATTDKFAALSTTLVESLDDIKQVLHVLPTTVANANNIYQPAQGTLSGILAMNNFNDPITFVCGAIQAASRLGAEQSAKLCVQYLAPIVKNRQFNFLPLGFNPVVGTSARPNELTYSEDWMRPDYVPPQQSSAGVAPASADPGMAMAAEAPTAQVTDPAAGLSGMMVPPAGTP